MSGITRGFTGRRSAADGTLPPGQYLTQTFPVLSAGPTPRMSRDEWKLEVTDVAGQLRQWDFSAMVGSGPEDVEVNLHCVTGWSKLQTRWRGVSLDRFLSPPATGVAQQVLVHSYGGYTTNLPLADLLGGQAWLVYDYDGQPLTAEHGGPVRLLVPHLYLWKSAKWVRALNVTSVPVLGFWERLGYHAYGDPWKEQRYSGD